MKDDNKDPLNGMLEKKSLQHYLKFAMGFALLLVVYELFLQGFFRHLIQFLIGLRFAYYACLWVGFYRAAQFLEQLGDIVVLSVRKLKKMLS